MVESSKIAFELLKIASSAPLKYGSVMFLYSIGVLPSKKMGKIAKPINVSEAVFAVAVVFGVVE